uniref:GAF domain-containing protein n=1 Tax=Hanusia phi TaxID=3032 RepID=A0A7S0EHB2_9CRYP|mmetsp:Transcript_24541/g.55388  ORF Transcript_24541/g.55388 Transcript_24541/m.55388 type:complete len:1055 (+) Transcript_24541:885-4049(+)
MQAKTGTVEFSSEDVQLSTELLRHIGMSCTAHVLSINKLRQTSASVLLSTEVLNLHVQKDKYDLARSAAISLKRLLQTERSFMKNGGQELTARLLIRDKGKKDTELLWKPQNGMKAIRVPRESDAYKAVLMKRTILRNDNSSENISEATETLSSTTMEPASCLMVPALNREHEVEAIVQVIKRGLNSRFDKLDVWMIESLVQHVGAALENIEIRESSASSWLNKIETFEYSVMGSVVSTIKTLLECEHVEIVPFLETPTGARVAPYNIEEKIFISGQELSISSLRKSLAQKVAIERTLLILKDSETASRSISCEVDTLNHKDLDVRNICAAPCLHVDGSLEGVLLAFNSTTGINFGKKDEIRSVKIANDVATFLRNCNEFSKVHREVERQKSTLNKYMSDIKYAAKLFQKAMSSYNIEESIAQSQRMLRKLLEADFACLYLYDEEAKLLRWVPVGVRKEDLDAYKCHDTGFAVTEAQDSVAGAVALRAKKLEVIKGRVLNNNAEAKSWDENFLSSQGNMSGPMRSLVAGSMLCYPVLGPNQKVVGVLQVARLADTSPENSSAWPQPFSKRSKEILDLVIVFLRGHLLNLLCQVEKQDRQPQVSGFPTQVVDPLPGLLNQGIRECFSMAQKIQKWFLANFDADQILIYLLDERDMAFELFYQDKSFVADLESGFAWRAMNERILKSSKISENKFVNKDVYEFFNLSPQHSLCCPLRRANGKPFGVVELLRGGSTAKGKEALNFNRKEELTIFRLCTRISHSLENAWRLRLLSRIADFQKKRIEFSLNTGKLSSPAHFIESLTAELERRIHCMLYSVYIFDGSDAWTIVRGESEPVRFSIRGSGILGLVVDNYSSMKQPFYVNQSAAKDPDFHDPYAGNRRIKSVTILAVPLVSSSSTKKRGIKDQEQEDQTNASDPALLSVVKSAVSSRSEDFFGVLVLTNRLEEKPRVQAMTCHAELGSHQLLDAESGLLGHLQSRAWKNHGDESLFRSLAAKKNSKGLLIRRFTDGDVDLVQALVQNAVAGFDFTSPNSEQAATSADVQSVKIQRTESRAAAF